jgi:uncharacterized small protein (DUF1192 family)
MPRSRAVQIRFTERNLRVIELLMVKLGIDTRAGLVKHAIARLADQENIKTPSRSSAK